MRKIAIGVSIDFFGLERFHKTLSPCVIPGIARSTHAEDHPVGFQLFDVGSAGILNPAIGVMDESRRRPTLIQGKLQSFQR